MSFQGRTTKFINYGIILHDKYGALKTSMDRLKPIKMHQISTVTTLKKYKIVIYICKICSQYVRFALGQLVEASTCRE
jgi:hypothetical protein